MSREWQPGDVVAATVNGRPNVRLVAGWSRYAPQLRWCELSPRWGDGDDDECWFFPSHVLDARPLLVIDPEDAEAVGTFLDAYVQHRRQDKARGVAFRDAARDVLTPPKPDEPQQLGAVVIDTEGVPWVCVEDISGDRRWYARNRIVDWADVAAVKVVRS